MPKNIWQNKIKPRICISLNLGYNHFKDNWELIVETLINKAGYDGDLERIKNLFTKFDISYVDYTEDESVGKNTLIRAINRIFIKEADEIVNQNMVEVFTINDFESLEENVFTRFNELVTLYVDEEEIEPEYNPCEGINAEELIAENNLAAAEAESDDE